MSTEEQRIEQKPVFKQSSFQINKSAKKKCVSINAPPSFKPPEKFSDLSGLPAPYTDPQTRLRFANKDEYATIIDLPMDITAGYLAIRGATSIVG
ncbi:hypothetical protein NQ314_017933 [Rhamnusium bicolor]|uniref:Vps72/YL1 C-terminal domain-containing protein n=1 Tax=Rhamnusium bicolor TaxID=1586634 RepID=A0AAV8WSA8_9CUCU|nr:hypothetical protein NQ314_017933 [Rhamnusium bicolor]